MIQTGGSRSRSWSVNISTGKFDLAKPLDTFDAIHSRLAYLMWDWCLVRQARSYARRNIFSDPISSHVLGWPSQPICFQIKKEMRISWHVPCALRLALLLPLGRLKPNIIQRTSRSTERLSISAPSWKLNVLLSLHLPTTLLKYKEKPFYLSILSFIYFVS